MFLHQFINSDFYKILNGQLFAACIGASVTIAGVWLTIYNDRKARRNERRNEIKPVYSVSFLGIEDTIELNTSIKYFINKNTFSYMPILQIAQSFMKIPLVAYSDRIGIDTPFKRETALVFQFHVDGNYPIKNVEATSIKSVSYNESGYIQTNGPLSIGPSPVITDTVFNFYHKTVPNNFELSNDVGIRHRPLDIQMINVYISPGETVYFKVPINIGCASLSSLVRFICKDPNFMSSDGITYHYPFDNPEELDRFLENMNSFPIQVNICFKITDIEGNIYKKEQPVYAYFDIRKLKNTGNKDYSITGGMTTSSIFPNDINEINGLKEYIEEQFSNNKNDTQPK